MAGVEYPLHEKSVKEIQFQNIFNGKPTYLFFSQKENQINDTSESITGWIEKKTRLGSVDL